MGDIVNYAFPVDLAGVQVGELASSVAAAASYVIKGPAKKSGYLRDVQLSLQQAYTANTTTGASITVGTSAGDNTYCKAWKPVAAGGSSAAATVIRASDTTPTASTGIVAAKPIPRNGSVVVTFAAGTGGSASGGAATCNVLIEWS